MTPPRPIPLLLLCAALGCTTQRPALRSANLAAPAAIAPQPQPKTVTLAWQAGYEPHGNAYVQLGWTGLDRSSDLVHWTPETRFMVSSYRQWCSNTVPVVGDAGFFRVVEFYRK